MLKRISFIIILFLCVTQINPLNAQLLETATTATAVNDLFGRLDKSVNNGFNRFDNSVNNAYTSASLLISQLRIEFSSELDTAINSLSGERRKLFLDSYLAIEKLVESIEQGSENINEIIDSASTSLEKLVPGTDDPYARKVKIKSPYIKGATEQVEIVVKGSNLGNKKNHILVSNKKLSPANSDETSLTFIIPVEEIVIEDGGNMKVELNIENGWLFFKKQASYNLFVPVITDADFEIALEYISLEREPNKKRTKTCSVKSSKTRVKLSSWGLPEIDKGDGSNSCPIVPFSKDYEIIAGTVKTLNHKKSKHCERNRTKVKIEKKSSAGFIIKVTAGSDKDAGSTCSASVVANWEERKIKLSKVVKTTDYLPLKYSSDGVNLSCPTGNEIRGIVIRDKSEEATKKVLPLATKRYSWLSVNYDTSACLAEVLVDVTKL